MSKRDRRDMDGRDRDRRDVERRDRDWDDEGQHRRVSEGDTQEGDSLTALKAILSKVASQLRPLNLSADESIRLVEQLYGSVLEMDSAMAGEADDTRKSSTLAYIQNTSIRREGDKVLVEFPTAEELRAARTPAQEAPAGQVPSQTPAADVSQDAAAAKEPAPARPPRGGRPRQQAPRKEEAEAAPESAGQIPPSQESGHAAPQQPAIDPAQVPAEQPVPEDPEV